MSTRITALNAPRDVESPLHSQGVLISGPGDLVFVSGQVGVRADATVGHGIVDQTQIAFDNVSRVLAEARLSLSSIASLRIYLTSHDDIESFTRVAGQCLAGHRPATTLILVELLADPALIVQIEAVAVG